MSPITITWLAICGLAVSVGARPGFFIPLYVFPSLSSGTQGGIVPPEINEHLLREDVTPEQLTDAWMMPPSRSEAEDTSDSDGLAQTVLRLPSEIGSGLSNASVSLRNASDSIQQTIHDLQTKLANDVSASLKSGEGTNITQEQAATPGFFDSFTMVSSFLDLITSLFTQAGWGSSNSTASATVDTQRHRAAEHSDIELPELGDVGEMTNDAVESVLNSVTVWAHRHSGKDCVKRLVCETSRKITFERGYTLPSIMTYVSNVILSAVVNDGKMSDVLLAARKGRKGKVDCLKAYPACNVIL